MSLAIWLLIQLIVLALAAGSVSLSAGFVRPPQRLALEEMLVVQFAGSGMLFPLLFSRWSAVIGNILAGGAMIWISGYLSGAGAANLLLAWCCLGLWLCALGVVANRSKLSVLIAIANLLSIGGLIVWYLSSEFGGLNIGSYFPLPGLLKAIDGGSWAFPLSSTAIIFGISIIFSALSKPSATARRFDKKFSDRVSGD